MSNSISRALAPARRIGAYAAGLLATTVALLSGTATIWSNPVLQAVSGLACAAIALYVLNDTLNARRPGRGPNERPAPMFGETEVAGALCIAIVVSILAGYNAFAPGRVIVSRTRIDRALRRYRFNDAVETRSLEGGDQKDLLLRSNAQLVSDINETVVLDSTNIIMVGAAGA